MSIKSWAANKIQGLVANDAVAVGNPVLGGGLANDSTPTNVANGDAVVSRHATSGEQYVVLTGEAGLSDNASAPTSIAQQNSDTTRPLGVTLLSNAPDTGYDLSRSAGDIAPALGALNVAPIGGDITLRASAIAGEADGTATAVDNLGWVKSFNIFLDVTAVPTGGSPTLDVHIQTQLASGDWQDIIAFTQRVGSAASEIASWGPVDGNLSGIGVEGVAVTFDRLFAEQNGAMTAGESRLMNLGDSMRVEWDFVAGGSSGDFTFSVVGTFHS